ncbi:GntR family transcriptional regulator [Bauldia sp.]|uniref:GntR family transcriptional regulator n=1 Tax=Bauldia sp. TaxID=2575872 RepID=UPI003BADA569
MSHAGFVERLQARIQDDDSDDPLYRRIADEISEAIDDGLIKHGQHLPSERTLSKDLSVSRVTLRKALESLFEDGVLLRKQGAKTIVAPRLEKAVSALTGFSEDMRARGREPGARWLFRAVTAPTPKEALMLGIPSNTTVSRLERVRLADDEPVAIERATIPSVVLPDPYLVDTSLYAALEVLGARPMRGMQRMRAVAANNRDAQILKCEPGAPIFCVERRCFAADDRCVEFTETRYLGTAYDFVTDLN